MGPVQEEDLSRNRSEDNFGKPTCPCAVLQRRDFPSDIFQNFE